MTVRILFLTLREQLFVLLAIPTLTVCLAAGYVFNLVRWPSGGTRRRRIWREGMELRSQFWRALKTGVYNA